MKYEKSQHQGVFIGIFIFSIISFLVILSAPFKMVTGETLNYWHLSGFGYHELRVFFILIPSFLLIILLIFIPVFDLAFKKQFTKADFRNINGMAISGSMIGIIVSV